MSASSQSVLSCCLAMAMLVAVPAVFRKSPSQDVKSNAGEAGKPADTGAKKIAPRIDLNAALKVSLPEPKQELVAANFSTPDGKNGWVLRIPGGRPIATPAYANGMLFVGGGYGSHEFYAVDSDTGKIVWKIQTSDDGPTAAVVADGRVAFNTESCTLVIVDEETGRVIWEEWLGDPLMSQPAIDKGVLYMAHPAATGRPAKEAQFHPRPATPGGSHRLLAADLQTGRPIWEQQIAGDVITAPVISNGTVYFTTFNGVSYALNAADGSVLWVKENAATSAPVVMNGQLFETRKTRSGKNTYEGIARVDAKQGTVQDKDLIARSDAAYLEKGKGGGVAIGPPALMALDASVGFAAAPSSAKLDQASENLGVSSVVGAWAYQGSRTAVSKGQILNAQGNYVNSVRASDGRQNWQAEFVGTSHAPNGQLFSPPAVGRSYLYLAGAGGQLVSVRQSDGGVGFSYALGAPMAFQPALAKGNVYAGTTDGRLICLKTGDRDAEGWYAWGGNAQHNKVQ
ncbi:MAG TPA: PQQ-binding-like beta-propeller repeat protein [Candidatus Limnocylindrales bacterium]|nr:PQQ-binding-like beta-propeller repeat protein [Candidatus Limnocylindrales bacterium]